MTRAMKYVVIGDPDTVLGFGLAGVAGEAVESPDEAERALDNALNDEAVGVILITERTAAAIQAKVDDAILNRPSPVLVEIPDRRGPLPGRKTLMELIRQAIGVGV